MLTPVTGKVLHKCRKAFSVVVRNIIATFMHHLCDTKGKLREGNEMYRWDLQPIFFHFSVEGTSVNVKKSGGLAFIAASGAQCFNYVVFLTDERFIKIRSNRRRGCLLLLKTRRGRSVSWQRLYNLIGEMFLEQRFTLAENAGSLNNMTQLPDVPWPLIVVQRIHGLI